jgi:hypothetical protein
MGRTSQAVRILSFAVLSGTACIGGGHASSEAPRGAEGADAPALERRLVGCYRLELGAWSRPFPSGWPEVHEPPELVRLDAMEVDEFGQRWHRLAPQLAVLEGRPRAFEPVWRLRDDGRVELRWSSGFSGVRLLLRAERTGTLRGEAVALYDVIVEGEPIPTAQAVATRAPCGE